MLKLKQLENDKDNVFTLESEESASEAQRDLTIAIKRRKLQAQAEQIKNSLTKSGTETLSSNAAKVHSSVQSSSDKVGLASTLEKNHVVESNPTSSDSNVTDIEESSSCACSNVGVAQALSSINEPQMEFECLNIDCEIMDTPIDINNVECKTCKFQKNIINNYF